jgi:hypothetical protein
MTEHVDSAPAVEGDPWMHASRSCETCGNVYDKAFQVVMDGESHTFDSFECAIQLLAPTCTHCGCRIIGHGVESEDSYFCCASCAKLDGVAEVKDRA